jgi:hypothetical protein
VETSAPTLTAADTAGAVVAIVIGGVFVLAMIALGIVIYWRIAAKAGYPGAMSLLMLVPLVNIILLVLFAFGEWPIERQLRALQSGAGVLPGTAVMPPIG